MHSQRVWPHLCPACLQGNLRPEEALQALTIYEGKFGRLKDDREKCAKAKEALELTDTGLLSGSEERVQVRVRAGQPCGDASTLPRPRCDPAALPLAGGLGGAAGPQRCLV